MINFTANDNAFIERLRKEQIKQHQAYDQEYDQGLLKEERPVRSALIDQIRARRIMLSTQKPPLESEGELIWQDRQYLKNKKIFGENQINGIFGQFSFDRQDAQVTEEKYKKAFKNRMVPASLDTTGGLLKNNKDGKLNQRPLKEIVSDYTQNPMNFTSLPNFQTRKAITRAQSVGQINNKTATATEPRGRLLKIQGFQSTRDHKKRFNEDTNEVTSEIRQSIATASLNNDYNGEKSQKAQLPSETSQQSMTLSMISRILRQKPSAKSQLGSVKHSQTQSFSSITSKRNLMTPASVTARSIKNFETQLDLQQKQGLPSVTARSPSNNNIQNQDFTWRSKRRSEIPSQAVNSRHEDFERDLVSPKSNTALSTCRSHQDIDGKTVVSYRSVLSKQQDTTSTTCDVKSYATSKIDIELEFLGKQVELEHIRRQKLNVRAQQISKLLSEQEKLEQLEQKRLDKAKEMREKNVKGIDLNVTSDKNRAKGFFVWN